MHAVESRWSEESIDAITICGSQVHLLRRIVDALDLLLRLVLAIKRANRLDGAHEFLVCSNRVARLGLLVVLDLIFQNGQALGFGEKQSSQGLMIWWRRASREDILPTVQLPLQASNVVFVEPQVVEKFHREGSFKVLCYAMLFNYQPEVLSASHLLTFTSELPGLVDDGLSNLTGQGLSCPNDDPLI